MQQVSLAVVSSGSGSRIFQRCTNNQGGDSSWRTIKIKAVRAAVVARAAAANKVEAVVNKAAAQAVAAVSKEEARAVAVKVAAAVKAAVKVAAAQVEVVASPAEAEPATC